MKHLFASLAAVAPLVLVTAAQAEEFGFETGNSLFQKCQSANPHISGICTGYVIGVVDILAQEGNPAVGGFRACPPRGITISQARDIATNWLQANPQHRHHTGRSLVAAAMEQAFPCASLKP